MTEDIHHVLRSISSEFVSLGDQYIYARVTSPQPHNDDETPVKVDGFMLLFVKQGSLTLDINMEHHTVTAGSIVSIPHSSLFKTVAAEEQTMVEILIFSTKFLQNININFTVINTNSFIVRQDPCQQLSAGEWSTIDLYVQLLRLNALDNTNLNVQANIAANLVGSMIYQMVLFHYRRIGYPSVEKRTRSAHNTYVHDFIKLVHVHFSRERSIDFYAGKLCISPKYLSLLVKNATGKSAAKWIDEFVLMEAKNMLRFSGKNVQQVAYALNFTNQSSFGKYFKHMTGMSPTEYQKS